VKAGGFASLKQTYRKMEQTMKHIIAVISFIAILIGGWMLAPTVAVMQSEVACEQDVIVQANDSLSKLAQQFYGHVLAFPAIVEATNTKAAGDNSYTRIDNVNVVELGAKLCIPSQTEAQAILAKSGGVAIGAVDPTVDRVGFPEGYQESYARFYEFDRAQNKTARVIYANEAAASVQPGQPFPYGSILVMEVYRTQQDDAGKVVLDANGRFTRGELSGIFVMRKEPGFGAKYGDQRNGEWEYVAYKADGTFLTPPERTQPCAACHVETSGKDWVFGSHRFFGDQAPAAGENEIIVADYSFQPETLTVKANTEVKWTSQDVVFHTVTANDLSLSRALRPGETFTHKFEQPGTYEFFSAFYPTAKVKVIVE
jgi:hemoglobin